MDSPVNGLVDHLFRRQSGRMVATLTSILGPPNIQLAEDVVQQSLLRALELWPFHGVPDNPEAWLVRVARNLALDSLRRNASLAAKIPEIERRMQPAAPTSGFDDDQLSMMFLSCHPQLPNDARVCLTLKVVAGFSIPEIASAFLAKPETIAQRIIRAKRQIREQSLSLEMPPLDQLPARLDSVLDAVYLIFNEGYSASAGESLLRRELCDEAIYLTRLLAAQPVVSSPKVDALLSLQLFAAARLDARTDEAGNLLLLEEQDRTRWDRTRITEGFHYFDRSARGTQISTYHLQAAIAAAHASAPSLDDTDWPQIASLYDQLLQLNPSPVVILNRAVAIARRDGAPAGLREIETIRHHPALSNYYLLHAVMAWLHEQTGEFSEAEWHYRSALACRTNQPEQRFLSRRLAQLTQR